MMRDSEVNKMTETETCAMMGMTGAESCVHTVEHNVGQDCTKLFTLLNVSPILVANFDQINQVFFYTLVDMVTYSEVLAAPFEPGTWIIYVSRRLNLENLDVENCTSNAPDILGKLHPL